MIDPRDWKPQKPQCIHHNDADNCYACGTGRVSKGPNTVFDATSLKSFNRTGSYTPSLCQQHDTPNPCLQCSMEDWVREAQEEKRLEEVARINEISDRIWKEIAEQEARQREAATEEERRKLWTCEHGIYLLEAYCGECSIRFVDAEYDRNKYRTKISEALTNAKVNFRAAGYYPDKDRKEVLTEDEKNFQDLLQLVDLEVWKASRHYGEKMNGALAGSVAENVAGKFTTSVIEDQTIATGISWEHMPPEYREHAFDLFTRVGGLNGLVRLSKDDRAPANDRAMAKNILNEYGFSAPRFESFDIPTEFANETNGGDSTSAAEYELHKQGRAAAPTAEEIFEAHRPALELLVKSWRGDMRKVGEAMLAGSFNVREVPGVGKNNASKLFHQVKSAFQARIANLRN